MDFSFSDLSFNSVKKLGSSEQKGLTKASAESFNVKIKGLRSDLTDKRSEIVKSFMEQLIYR